MPQLAMAEQRTFLLSTVAGVTVSEMEVGITLRRSALRAALLAGARSAPAATSDPGLGEASAVADELVIWIPAHLKLCSGEMRFVIPPAQARELRPRPNAALIKALSRTQRWRLRLFSDPAFSLRAIARDEGLGERYVSHLLPLAFLAPDIAEAILDGHQPGGLDLEQLLQSIPLSWAEQRRRLRFVIRD